jgi:hypothetical protein
MPETYKTGAIGDKRKLLKFFAAKEHKNLVLRIADVLELRNDQQDWIIGLANLIRLPGLTFKSAMPEIKEAQGMRKRWLLHQFPGGYIVLPFDELLGPMDMAQVKQLQEVCYAYHGVRMGKGEPSRVDKCDKCEGRGRVDGKKCKQCDGSGMTVTFLEMSDEEKALAKGVD